MQSPLARTQREAAWHGFTTSDDALDAQTSHLLGGSTTSKLENRAQLFAPDARRVRAVTHLDVSRADIDTALGEIQAALR